MKMKPLLEVAEEIMNDINEAKKMTDEEKHDWCIKKDGYTHLYDQIQLSKRRFCVLEERVNKEHSKQLHLISGTQQALWNRMREAECKIYDLEQELSKIKKENDYSDLYMQIKRIEKILENKE